MSALAQASETSSKKNITLILVGSAVMFAILELGITWLAARMDQTWATIIAAAVMVVAGLIFERAFFGRNLPEAVRDLGYGLWNPHAVLTAFIILLVTMLFFPLFSLVTGAQIKLLGNWWWILISIVVFNGFGEETLFRGYIFGGLRMKAGLTFRQAGFVSMIIFAAVHLLLFIGNPPIIAILGLIIVVAAAFPMAYLFERGNNTIWAPVVLHYTFLHI